MPGVAWYRTVSIGVASLCLSLASLTVQAQIRLDLPPQPLAQALTSLGNLANLNIYFDPAVVDGHQAPAVKANLSADEALTRLLAGTHLKAVRVDENTVRVVSDVNQQNAQTARAPATGAVYTPSNSMHLAYAGAASQPDTTAASTAADSLSSTTADAGNTERNRLETVVVSAEKRDERLQDVPVPVTAVSADILANTNQQRIQDYYTLIPGLSVTPADTRGTPVLAIRGVTTGGSLNPTVGITIDDVPYGSTTILGGGFAAPDIDPSDLSRIEVLRGPQGTLYGASSIGGLMKFVTADPSTTALTGHLQAGLSDVDHGNGLGYNVRGAVNVPVNDALAIRASAFSRTDPGYIDNVLTGQKGVNRLITEGGHVSALWRLSDDFSIKLSALLQHAHTDGSSEVDLIPGLGFLQQSRVRDTGGYDKKVQAYSLTLKDKFAGIDLTSLTGYSINRSSDSQDFTAVLGPLTQGQFGVTGTPTAETNRTAKFSQEVRLSSSIGTQVDWLAGAFFTHETSSYIQDILAADPLTRALAGVWSTDSLPSTYTEYAAFANFTLHFTDQFDLQLGGRESQNKQTYSETIAGPFTLLDFGLPSPIVNPEVHTKDNSFTYLVTPRYKLSPDLMLYARLASGYRPGGPNNLSTVFAEPASYQPDTTRNYEVGFKGSAFNKLLAFDASLYYIDWNHIQLVVVDPANFASFFINGTRAKSQGAELTVELRPLSGLTIAAWVAFNDAVLKEGLPPGAFNPVGAAGDRLPDSSRFSGNLSVQQDFRLSGNLTGFVGANVAYVGDRQGVFVGAPPRQDFPGYGKTDLRAGLVYSSWTFNFYMNNVTNNRGLLAGGAGTFNPQAFIYVQPRTTGISIDKTF